MLKKYLAAVILILFVSATQNSLIYGKPTNDKKHSLRATVTESFDSSIKNYYASGSITGSLGDWYVEEGLLGYSTRDKKVGTKAVRLRDAGKLL